MFVQLDELLSIGSALVALAALALAWAAYFYPRNAGCPVRWELAADSKPIRVRHAGYREARNVTITVIGGARPGPAVQEAVVHPGAAWPVPVVAGMNAAPVVIEVRWKPRWRRPRSVRLPV